MQKRTNEIKLRLSNEELHELNQNSSVCKCSREKYLRMVLDGVVIHTPPPLPYYDLIKQINAVGNNLNQLVKLGHMQALDVHGIQSVMHQLEEMILSLDRTIRG